MKQKFKRFLNSELNHLAYNIQRIDPIGNPVVFQIELTNHCPMTCIICPRTNRMTRKLGFMDEYVFKRIIDETDKFSSKIFFHHFGESLLHPKLDKFLNYACERKIKTFLSANPVLLTPKRSKKLIDNGLYELVLSLDGLTSETNAAIRGHIASNVILAEKNILSFLEHRKKVNFKTPYLIMQIVRQKQNVHEISGWVKKWSKVNGIDRVKVKSYITWDGQDDQINSMKPEDINFSVSRKIVCDKPWTSITVLWDGRVVPCCFDYDGIYVLGDINIQTLKEIWNGEKMKYLRKCHRDGKLDEIELCKHCKDMEGYSVKKWFYPINRFLMSRNILGDEWSYL